MSRRERLREEKREKKNLGIKWEKRKGEILGQGLKKKCDRERKSYTPYDLRPDNILSLNFFKCFFKLV